MPIGPTANIAEQNYNYLTIKFESLNIDEMVVNNASFKNIMEDGVVTEEEIKGQSDKVVAILHDMESKYSEEQLSEIKNLLVESSVLYAVYNFYSIQNINK